MVRSVGTQLIPTEMKSEHGASSNGATTRIARLTVVIPARDEEACIAATVEHLHAELRLHDIPHEIIVVDDGSRDQTYAILLELKNAHPRAAAAAEHRAARVWPGDRVRPRSHVG